MNVDIEELKRKAEAATPGVWNLEAMLNDIRVRGDHGNLICEIRWNSHDGNYIAAANPQTVLSLIAEIESLKQHDTRDSEIASLELELASLRKQLEEAKKDSRRLDFITTFGKPWSVQWEKRGTKPVRYRMIHDGESWGQWHTNARAAIDAAQLKEQNNG